MHRLKQLFIQNATRGLPLIDQAMVSGTNFLLSILITRFIGLESYGVFALCWMIVLLVSSIQQSFIIEPMLTMGPKKDKDAQKTYYDALVNIQIIFSVATAIILMGLSVIIPLFKPAFSTQHLLFVSAVSAAFVAQDFFRKLFYANEQSSKAVFIDAVAYPLQLVVLVIVYWFVGLSLISTFALILCCFSISSLLGYILSPFKSVNFAEIKRALAQNWKFAKWLVAKSSLQWFAGNFFIMAAGALLSSSAVGVIRIIQNIMGVTHVFFLSLENFVPARASKHFIQDGYLGLRDYLKKITLQSGLITALMLAGIGLFGKLILVKLYGAEYAQYDFLVWWFCALYVLVFFGYPLRYALRTTENTRPIFTSYILSMAGSLLLAYPLIQQFGLIGIVIGLISAQLIMQTWYLFVIVKDAAKWQI